MDEAMFSLCYHVPGLTWGDLENITPRRRDWLMNRLIKQKKMEQDAMKR